MADDPTIRWALASSFGIQVDEAQDAWYSGHVNDILELDTGQLLVATATGGVWVVDPASTSLPLSNDWFNPDINCLAFGPDDPRHVFAGCTRGIIRETDLGEGVPLLAWREIEHPLPKEAGDVYRIVVIRNLRRIVAACQNGLFWATIPPTPPKGGGSPAAPRPPYQWVQAKVEGDPDNQGFWDVAIGATRDDTPRSHLEDRRAITIVAGGLNGGGIFVGQWNSAGDLMMTLSKIHNEDGTDATGLFVLVGACSVTSCEIRPNTLYAACSWKDGRLFRVLRSHDGGKSWGILTGQVTSPSEDDLSNVAGDQGSAYNNVISVSPTNPGLVMLGWVSIFLTLDGGKSWRLIEDTHLHPDIHALRFNPENVGSIGSVFIGSDGGVARINLDDYLNPPGTPFQSNYNRQLPTLQCLETRAEERFYGTLGASKTTPGLIATGAQDNGNLHCLLGASPTAWVDLDGGDGAWNAFIAEGAYLHNTLDGPVAATQLNSTAGVVTSGVVPILHPPVSTGLDQPVGEPVSHPSFRNFAGHPLQAVAAVKNQIFGFYVDDYQSPRYYYDQIGSIPPDEVAAGLASYHGGTIFVGTQSGKMYAIDSRLGTKLELPVILPKPDPHAVVKGGYINRIVAFSESDVFAVMNGATAEYEVFNIILGKIKKKVTSYYVLRLDGLKWVVTPGVGLMNERMLGLEAVTLPQSRVPHALFVSTDERVYISRDDGDTWQPASQGLPRFPHCTDLRFVSFKTEAYLYLGTYGRSVWAAKLL